MFLGGLLGAILIGAGGRALMRLLVLHDGRPPSFSWGGSLEIVAYGAVVGAISGATHALVPTRWGRGHAAFGVVWGVLTYFATVVTLPDHIAATARPFAAIMPLVHVGFGTFFVSFGVTLSFAGRPR